MTAKKKAPVKTKKPAAKKPSKPRAKKPDHAPRSPSPEPKPLPVIEPEPCYDAPRRPRIADAVLAIAVVVGVVVAVCYVF